MSWNIEKPGDRINGPVTITGNTTLTGTATISGDLTVDTSTLKVDAANNRVGVGTASPSTTFDVVGDAKVSGGLVIDTTSLVVDAANNRVGIGTATPNATVSIKQTGAQIDVSTSATDVTFEAIDRAATTNAINTRWYTRNGEFQWNNSSYSRAMTLDSSGRLGIGTATPAANLHVNADNASTISSILAKMGGGDQEFKLVARNGDGGAVGNVESVRFGLERVGVWNSGIRFFRGGAGNDGYLLFSTSGQDRLTIASDGVCTWSNVGGVAGTAMTLNASGDLAIGRTAAFYPLANRRGLTLNGSAGSIFVLGYNNSPGGYLLADASGTELSEVRAQALRFGTNSTERARITSGGDFRVKGAGTAGSTDAVQFSGTAPASSLLLDSSGNLGIGTATPSESLDVNGAIYVRGANALKLDNASNNYVAQIKNTGASGQSSLEFLLGSPYGTKMTLDNSGNLGLGVTPSAKLEVRTVSNDTIVKSNAVFAFGDFTTLNAGLIGQQSLSSPYQFNLQACDTAGTAYFPLLLQPKGGQVLFGTSGTASAPTFAKFGDTNTGLYFPTGNDTLALAVGGSDAVYIDAGRNVGIGTSTPAGKLHVVHTAGQAAALLQGGHLEFYKDATPTAAASIGLGGPASGSTNDIVFNTYGGTWAERLRIKSTGQVNFVGQASDPAGAAAGDVYYNTTTNKLKCYNGTTWNDLF